jgi:hypothetical protein
MPNPNYQKGYRFEKKAQAWFVHLGRCVRSFMSRGADLVLTRGLREWGISCKCRAKISDFTLKQLLAECEKRDFCVFGADRETQWFLGPVPKVVELCTHIEGISDEPVSVVSGRQAASRAR